MQQNQHWLPSLFNDFLGEEWVSMRPRRDAAPAVNILEHEKCFKIEIAAPGMTKEDFHLSMEGDNRLVVSLEKCCEKEKKEKEKCADEKCEQEKKAPTYLRREFALSTYRQTFLIPDSVDCSKIEAKMHHGVLKIKLPKKEHSEMLPASRQIEIR